MMTILPDRFDDDQRRGGRNVAKDLHAVLLAVDETVLLGGVVGVTALDVAARASDGGHDGGLDAFLGGPTLAIGGEPQIPICDYNDRIGHLSTLWHDGGGGIIHDLEAVLCWESRPSLSSSRPGSSVGRASHF